MEHLRELGEESAGKMANFAIQKEYAWVMII
jgi:hypothetical protein